MFFVALFLILILILILAAPPKKQCKGIHLFAQPNPNINTTLCFFPNYKSYTLSTFYFIFLSKNFCFIFAIYYSTRFLILFRFYFENFKFDKFCVGKFSLKTALTAAFFASSYVYFSNKNKNEINKKKREPMYLLFRYMIENIYL